MKHHYRLIYYSDTPQGGEREPPLTPEQFVAQELGHIANTHVDAVFPSVTYGYRTMYPSKLPDVPYLGQDCGEGFKSPTVVHWKEYYQTPKLLIEAGHDPLRLLCEEVRRLGIDVWPDMHMNDWHHAHWRGGDTTDVGCYEIASPFYADHPELRIGVESMEQKVPGRTYEAGHKHLGILQDFAHAVVRTHRLKIIEEICTEYDVDGFSLDFMRIPIFFKPAEAGRQTSVMTEYVKEIRRSLDRIGASKGRSLGLAARVPLSIKGALNVGLDVAAWVKEGLVGLLVPTPFYGSTSDAQVSEYRTLVEGTGCRLYPSIEESRPAGYKPGPGIPDFADSWGYPSFLRPVTAEFARAQALHYYRSGADGIGLYNWENMAGNHGYDNSAALRELGDRDLIARRDKVYAASMVKDLGFCLGEGWGELPVRLDKGEGRITLRVAEDLGAKRSSLEEVMLWINLRAYSSEDEAEVRLNGRTLTPVENPLSPGSHTPSCESIWLRFDVSGCLPRQGDNEVVVSLVKCNQMINREKYPVAVTDVELDVKHWWPDGAFRPRNWYPRR